MPEKLADKVSEEDINREIGRLLRQARESAVPRMSQTRLGEVLGISFQMVQKYEKGTSGLSVAKLVLVAKTFNLPLVCFILKM